jgi:uncharacterized protein (TIGR04222 family)
MERQPVMRVLFGLWPWNVSNGVQFLVLFAAIGALSLALGWGLACAVVRRRESGNAPGISVSPRREVDGAQPYRLQAERNRLTVGSVPKLEDAWPIAYLRDGIDGLTDALASSAVAAGWVTEGEEAPLLAPTDPVLAALHERIGGVTGSFSTVRQAARSIAVRHADAIEVTLAAAGLVRDGGTRGRIAGAFAAPALFAVLVGIVRCVRAIELQRPRGFLVLEMLAIVAFSLTAAIVCASDRSARAKRYLGWLNAVTCSLRDDVVAGRRASVDDVASTVAIGGAAGMMRAEKFVAIVPVSAWVPASVMVSSSSYASSSSCASSGASCGGGGGGGGGCGG